VIIERRPQIGLIERIFLSRIEEHHPARMLQRRVQRAALDHQDRLLPGVQVDDAEATHRNAGLQSW